MLDSSLFICVMLVMSLSSACKCKGFMRRCCPSVCLFVCLSVTSDFCHLLSRSLGGSTWRLIVLNMICLFIPLFSFCWDQFSFSSLSTCCHWKCSKLVRRHMPVAKGGQSVPMPPPPRHLKVTVSLTVWALTLWISSVYKIELIK